ncbi:hypothetical protein SETIT_5G173000v2 [Setaria italica]|uniref:Uncharacterized protein n=1 Tax=Setaria italica TaxID=4555 RepID=A0A368R5N4_SETIT|nr:hypothetical protein SETIT_5G173000v2 [Setaria italica]
MGGGIPWRGQEGAELGESEEGRRSHLRQELPDQLLRGWVHVRRITLVLRGRWQWAGSWEGTTSGVPVPMCFCGDPCKWEAEKKETMEKRRREEAAEKEHKEEDERRRVAANREEREKKLEHARQAKAAIEENPDALRKGKWPRCTQ